MIRTAVTPEEKRALTSARQRAVRNAWKNEQDLVRDGKGTRDWTIEEQKELLESGSVDGYEGHHMKSVSLYPDYAGDADNIQFLSADEHFNGAHQGSYHNTTNGYYNPETMTMIEFSGNELHPVEARELSESYVKEEENAYVGSIDEESASPGSEDYTGNIDGASIGGTSSEYLGEAAQSEESAETNGESAESSYGID